jgi:hypothetical protein
LSHENQRNIIMATTAKNTNRSTSLATDQKLIDGLNKHVTTIPTWVIGGASYKSADLVAILQARIASANRARDAKPVWLAAVKADRDEQAKTKTVVSGLRQALQVAFAGSVEVLADFGLAPRKPSVTTPEQRTAAALKAKATRAARHTVGPKKKAAVKGAVIITPATAQPLPPAPAPAPALAPTPAHAPVPAQASPTGAAPPTPADVAKPA